VVELNRFLTNEQAAYLSRLYTGTEVPELRHAPAAHVRELERRYEDRGYRIQHLERLVHERKEQVEDLNHKLFEAMCDRNRAYNRIKELEDRLTETKKDVETVDCCRIHAEIDGIERGKTIHRLERRLHKANRKYKALHRAMHEDSRNLRQSLIKAVERLAQSIITPSPVEESAYGATWPRFADGAPVEVGDAVKGVMCDVEVASIVFRDGGVYLYDAGMFHYVKLRDGQTAQRPDGTRLALD
jgi:flagellar biosynthesis chaperone FliJ